MSDTIGPRTISQQGNIYGISTDGQALKNKADAEIDRILLEQYERGMKLLNDNKQILDEISDTLIENEKMTGIELLDIIKKHDPELVSQAKYEEAESQIADKLQENMDELEQKANTALDAAIVKFDEELNSKATLEEKMAFIEH